MSSANRKKCLFRIGATLELFLIATLAVSVRAAPNDEGAKKPEARVVFIMADRKDARTEKLATVLEAHLNALPVIWEVKEDTIPPDLANQTRSATVFLWLASDNETLFALIPELDNEPRQVVATGEEVGSSAWFEALAAIVYSDISSVIPEKSPEESPKESLPVEEKHEKPTEKNMSEPDSTPRVPSVWLGAFAAYIGSWPFEESAMQHGALVGLALWFTRYLEVDLSVRSLPAFEFDSQGDTVELKRWPLQLSLRGLLPLRNFRLTAGIGLFVDIFFIDGLSGELASGNADQAQVVFGSTITIGAEYWFTSWLGATVKGGVDLTTKEVLYTLEDTTLTQIRIARPHVSSGLVIRFPINGER